MHRWIALKYSLRKILYGFYTVLNQRKNNFYYETFCGGKQFKRFWQLSFFISFERPNFDNTQKKKSVLCFFLCRTMSSIKLFFFVCIFWRNRLFERGKYLAKKKLQYLFLFSLIFLRLVCVRLKTYFEYTILFKH